MSETINIEQATQIQKNLQTAILMIEASELNLKKAKSLLGAIGSL